MEYRNLPVTPLPWISRAFEQRKDIHAGLGPVYNATSCVDCHQNPVTGGPSQITELRVGHKDANGNFVNPTV